MKTTRPDWPGRRRPGLGRELRRRQGRRDDDAADCLRVAALCRRGDRAAALPALAAAALERSAAAVGGAGRGAFQPDVQRPGRPRHLHRLHRHPVAGAVRGPAGGLFFRRQAGLAAPDRHGDRLRRRGADRRRAAARRQSGAAAAGGGRGLRLGLRQYPDQEAGRRCRRLAAQWLDLADGGAADGTALRPHRAGSVRRHHRRRLAAGRLDRLSGAAGDGVRLWRLV